MNAAIANYPAEASVIQLKLVPENEDERITELHEYDILDTPSEKEFDALTKLACTVTGSATALISLVDCDRLWIKSAAGVDLCEMEREHSFCRFTILQNDVFEIENTIEHDHFRTNPMVTGSPFVRFYAGVPLRTSSGHNLGALCVIDDKPKKLTCDERSSLKALAQQVVYLLELRSRVKREKKLSAIKSRFISTAAHQFKTPLTVIQSNAELLQMIGQSEGCSVDVAEKLMRYTVRISRETDRMTTMINDTLALKQVSTRKDLVELKPCSVMEPLDSLCERFTTVFPDRPLNLEILGEPRLVKVDKTNISEAIGNLVSNAYKYSEIAPTLTIDFRTKPLKIVVRDSGIGIAQEDLKRLFEPYFRASNAEQHPGTGLGLSIAREYIQQSNGSLHVESKLNVGSTFTITFPQL